MKVAILSRESLPFHSYGGLQRYVWCLSQYLGGLGIEVEMLLPPPYNQNQISPSSNIKITFIGPRVRKPFFWLRYMIFNWRAGRYLMKNRPDILHAFEITPFFYLRKRKISPVVLQTFGNEPMKTRGLKRFFHLLRWVPFFTSVAQRADCIGSIGNKQTEEIKALFKVGQEKIFLLPDGVDNLKIERIQKSLSASREDLGLEKNDFILLCVARLAENKGIEYLIRALKILSLRMPKAKLILVGTGPCEGKIMRLIEKLSLLGRIIRFKGISDEKLYELYALADIFVLPTLYEGLPLVLLEAAASGLPIITTDITDNAQIVKNGVNGFLVQTRNAEALAEATIKIYGNGLRKQMSDASRLVAKDYDWEIVAKKAVAKYQQLLKKQKNLKEGKGRGRK